MQYSVVNFKQVLKDSESFRLDSEFFKAAYLEADRIIETKNFAFMSEVTQKIDVGFVGSMVHAYTSSDGVLLLQTQNIQEFFVDYSRKQHIEPWFHK
jgi:hypothetical protein